MTVRKLISSFLILTLALVFLGTALLWAAQKDASQGPRGISPESPRVFFPATHYEFEPVREGVAVKHDFIVENHGSAPLVIKSVRPD